MLDYSREIAPGRRFNAPGGARRARRAAECVPDGYGVSVRRPPDDGVEDVGASDGRTSLLGGKAAGERLGCGLGAPMIRVGPGSTTGGGGEGGGTAAAEEVVDNSALLVAPEDVGVDGARTGHVSV